MESYASVHKDHAGLFLMLSRDYNAPIGSRGVVAIYRGMAEEVTEKAISFSKKHKGETLPTLEPSEIEKLTN